MAVVDLQRKENSAHSTPGRWSRVSPGHRRAMRCGLRLPNRARHSAFTRSAFRRRQRVIQRIGARLVLQDISRDGRVLLTEEDLRHGIVRILVHRHEGTGPRLARLLIPLGRSSRRTGPPFCSASRAPDSGRTTPPASGRWTARPPCVSERAWPLASSPDGKWVLAEHPNPRALFLLPTGAGQKRRLEPGGIKQEWGRLFPDGKHVLVLGNAARQAATLFHSAGGRRPTETLHARGCARLGDLPGWEDGSSPPGPRQEVFSIVSGRRR